MEEENQVISNHNQDNAQSVIEQVNLNSGLMNAPLLIQNLGHLLAFAKTDFPIQADNQAFEFKHLRHPGSYQACVVQLCNLTGKSFSIAESSMHMISLEFKTVPDHIQSIQEIFENGEPEDLEDVPDLLKNIDNAAKKADKGMEDTYNGIKDSYDLINELLESLVAKKGNVQANLNEVQKDMERIKNDIVNKKNVDKELEDNLRFYQEELKDVTRKQKKAKEDKKFWDDVEVVGGVAVPLVTGLISYLATGKSDKSTFNAGLSSAAWTTLNKKARKESEDFSREINEAKRHSEHFQTLIQKNLEDIWENRNNLRKMLDKKAEMDKQEMKEEDVLGVIMYSLKIIGSLAEIFRAYQNYIVENMQTFSNATQNHLKELEWKTTKCLELKQNKKEMTMLKKKSFAKQAEESIKASQEILRVATSYHEVSKRHLDPMLSTLGKCKILDPDLESEKLKCCINDLEDQSLEAQEGIQNLIDENGKRKISPMFSLLHLDQDTNGEIQWFKIGLIGIFIILALHFVNQLFV